ncbi:MAG TPA: FG-GAP-like repeat-containing protein [Pseudomonadota bacterium]|nr:FG-GAP-like repeat-containing protein [Pseudomonadota bacterium]
MSLALLSCSRSPTLLVTVENVPATAQSLQVIATHAGLAAIMDVEPYELPQPPPATSTLLLRLPASFSGDIGVSVGAFKSPGGAGCLVATGSTSEAMFAGPDATLRVPLTAVTDSACTGSKVIITEAAPGLGTVLGGDTITLSGWGFKPGAKVTFGAGNTAARSVTYSSASQLKVVTPSKAGFGLTPVKVTNPDNTSATRSDIFRFYSDTTSFSGLPFLPAGDYSNANGFVFAIFNSAFPIGAAVAQPSKDYVRILLANGAINPTTIDYTALPAGSKPTGITAADFNKDGNIDVAVGTQGDSMVRILLNDGKGNLRLGGAAPVGLGPEAIVSGDLDGDGAADVAIANRPDNSITVLLNDGNGAIKSQSTVTGITDPVSLALGDLNFDGQLDLAVASYSTGAVTVLINSKGTFDTGGAPKATLQVGKMISSVLVKDVNSDGKLDLVGALPADNQVVVIVNNGLPNVAKIYLPTETGPRAVQTGDLNGDGFPDLVVPCNGTNTVDVFLNVDGAGLTPTTPYSQVPAQCAGPVQAALYDIDRDGRLDIGVLCQVGIGLLSNQTGL